MSHLSKPIQRPYRREQSHCVWLGIFCVKISYLFTVLVGNLEAKLSSRYRDKIVEKLYKIEFALRWVVDIPVAKTLVHWHLLPREI